MENHGWTRCKDQLPELGQIVYYFGPYIGIGIGRFDPTIQTQCYHEDENGNLVVEEMSQKLIGINHTTISLSTLVSVWLRPMMLRSGVNTMKKTPKAGVRFPRIILLSKKG